MAHGRGNPFPFLRDPAVMSAGSELDGKVAVVTGGNQGIGLAIARAMAAAGASVAIAARTEESLERAARTVRGLGPCTRSHTRSGGTA